MRKWMFLSLMIGWHECIAHPKDGVFVEGGLMTGMLASAEDISQKPSCSLSILCPQEFMKNAQPLFTTADVTSPLVRFKTTAPIKIALGGKGLEIQNFLPYTLGNVDIYMTTPQGTQVKVGSVQSLPKFTQTYVNPDLLPALANAPANSSFTIQPSAQSDPTTTRVLDALSQISVDLDLSFLKAPDDKWLTPTPKQAEELTDAMLNLTSLLSSQQFADAVLNAPFKFYDTASGEPVISPQEVLDVYRSKASIALGILSPKAGESSIEGLAGPGLLGLQPYLINPKSSAWTNYQTGSEWPMEVILHEFGHTKNYGHDGNMTYGKNGTGLVELGIKVWKQLGEANKLPINYDQIVHVPSPIYQSSFMRALSNAMPSGKTSSDAMVGFNVKSGYQQYFNDFVGLSYYGVLKYNFSKRLGYIKTISQVGLGVGTDLLIDFKTTYKTRNAAGSGKKQRANASRKTLVSTFGSFVGIRALWDSYVLNSIYKSAGNINAVVGFNYRFKHSKYSLGVSIPLIQNPLQFKIDTKDLSGNVVLYDGASHFNVFFNYGWVF
ncbi:porin family protein [Helicobacter salomonis]|uniref:hypothetical protein n=1 Tax=Helicobacter salomonis TaxID=56878 RepID=UPI0013152040|nr:hypothetical protein [Helicobacter salomonis]